MEFTHEQISEIISEITNGESGFHGLVKRGLESLMLTERSLHNETLSDVSNGFRGRRVCHGGKVFELRVPRSRNSNFYQMLLGVLKDQEEEAQKLVSSLYCSGLTTEQVGKIYEQFYGKHYSKSQVSRLLNTAREDVNAWLGRKLEKRYPILYIDATYVLTRRDESVSNEAYYTVIGFRPKYDAPVFWPERGNSVHLQQAPTLYPQKMQRTFAVRAHFLQRTLQMLLNRCKDHFRFIFLLNSFSV